MWCNPSLKTLARWTSVSKHYTCNELKLERLGKAFVRYSAVCQMYLFMCWGLEFINILQGFWKLFLLLFLARPCRYRNSLLHMFYYQQNNMYKKKRVVVKLATTSNFYGRLVWYVEVTSNLQVKNAFFSLFVTEHQEEKHVNIQNNYVLLFVICGLVAQWPV